MHVCVHVCTHIGVCMYVCVCMCVYGCVCMYVCMVVRSVRLFECMHVGAVVPVDGGKRAGSYAYVHGSSSDHRCVRIHVCSVYVCMFVSMCA